MSSSSARSSWSRRETRSRPATEGSAAYHRLPGKQCASLDGHTIEYVRAGEGPPAIVLLSGAGMDIDSWSKVYPATTTISTVVAYNCLGTGRSDRPTVPQSRAVIVATLQRFSAGDRAVNGFACDR